MTTKTESSSGFSLQPELFNKIYDDRKKEKEKTERENEIAKRRAENKKRQKEAAAKREEARREREKNKPMSRNEKIGWTIGLCILTLISVPLSIYFSASLLNKLKDANGPTADLKVGLPAEPESLPYKNVSRTKANATQASNNKSFSSSISDSQKGGKRRRYQKGGFNTTLGTGDMRKSAVNEAKGFSDSTKYGVPYSLAENDNPIISEFGEYFITYFSFVRGIGVKCMSILNDSFFKDFDPNKGSGPFSSNMGNKLLDWVVIAFVLPILVSVSSLVTWLSGSVSLFWSAINNQSIGMIPWLIFAGCTFFFGGNWPTNLLIGYKDIYLAARGASSSMDTFREYFSRYKFWWMFIIIALWGLWIWGFMGGGFGKKITREYDYQIWIWSGCITPIICLLIGIIGFATLF